MENIKKFKVEGWIKIPVMVEILAENASDACVYAKESVLDELPRGFSVIPSGLVEYFFAGEDEPVIIAVNDDYEYEFNTAELLDI